jgi:KaiC/GvpD/RAD55 family RecA-like ATPase/5S rRNA maturation endonuclease (ribonuclease M5)
MSNYQKITALGIKCKDISGQQKVNCPFCVDGRSNKKDKSLSVNVEMGVYKCHYPSCSASDGKSVNVNERKVEYVRPVSRLQKVSDKVVSWFESRGISNNTLLQFKVTEEEQFFPQVQKSRNAICFNYFKNDLLVNVKYRDAEKNFRMVSGAELIMYNLNSLEGYKWCVITEGECFMPSAEVLTEQGWISFQDLKKLINTEVKVAQYNNGSLEFVKPIAFVEKMYNGDMVVLKNTSGFESITTPEHNLVYQNKRGEIFKKKHYEASSSFRIPRIAFHNGHGIELSDNEIKLSIAISADFTIRKNGDVYGAFKKERKVVRIKEILNSLNIKYSCNLDSRGYHSVFIRRGDAPKYIFKLFPHEWISQSTQDQKKLIIDEILYWDGNSVPNRNQIEYSSKEYSNATFIQTISHLCGYCSTIIPRESKLGKWYKVSILFGKQTTSNQSLVKNKKYISYEGIVNCVQVPSGMIIVRQNNCISISGNCDAMALHESGIYPVVSVPNGASKGNQNLKYLDNCIDDFSDKDKIIIFTDNDSAGLSLRDELTRRLGRERIWYVNSIDGCKDANEILLTYGPEMLQKVIAEAYQIPIEGIEKVNDVKDKINDIYLNGFPTGLKAGYPMLDEHISFRGSEFTIITGTPNAGKSTFLSNIIVRLAAKHSWKIAMFSPEKQPTEILFTELAELFIGKSFFSYNPINKMTEKEVDVAREFVEDMFFFMKIDEMDVTIDGILDKAAELVKRNGINCLVIDPWNYVEHQVPKGMSETQYISEALTKVKRFKDRYGVHVFLVAHPTKIRKENGAYVVPTLYDIAGCHDEITEVLTNQGWKRHVDLDGTEEVACFDLESETLEYQKPSVYHKYPYKGDMYHFKGKSMDIMVSPNHRMIVGKHWKNKSSRKPSKYNSNKWNFIHAEDVSKSALLIPKSAKLKESQYISIRDFGDGEYYDNDKLAYLLGWYLSEGSISHNSITICQALESCTNLKKAFEDLNLHVKERECIGRPGEKTMYSFRVYAKSHPRLVKWIIKNFGNGAADKKIPVDFLRTLSENGKSLLLKSLIEGDGSDSKNGYKYHTGSKQLADDVSRLCIELGYKVTTSCYSPKKEGYLNEHVVFITKGSNTQWLMPVNHKKSYYEGNIYCLTVPTGAYITRRNGKVAITGNSAHFFNKCDNGFVVYRDYATGETQVHIQKIRWSFVGRVGEVRFVYDVKCKRFTEIGSEERFSPINDYEQKNIEVYGNEDIPF